ncbi:MAG TPA: endonuclease V [Candidatus Nanoarchaeia archaeon]|nr:endonuclease V [Candidatus Nanoarchaeia archaeon]
MNLQKLRQEQEALARKVLISDSLDEIKFIGGCDQAYAGSKIISSVIVLDAKTLEMVESATAVRECEFPYIPGYLSYRESPALLEAFAKLTTKPDVLLCDGNGILHPRRFGLACHVGIMLDIPTIGVAKSALFGEKQGDTVVVEKEVRGKEFFTHKYAKPIYLSPGHKINLQSAIEIVKSAIKPPHKLPEPLHLAHKHADKIREKIAAEQKVNVEPSVKVEKTESVIGEPAAEISAEREVEVTVEKEDCHG